MTSIPAQRNGRNQRRANGSANGPTTLTTALIYTRVSSDEQAREGLSLDTQLSECRRYAVGLGWMLSDEYQDVLSGSRDDRPGYQTLLADIRRLRAEGQTIVVVVAALDRFGRKLLERVRAREELKSLGVATHSVREGGEVSDLVANVLGSVAQEEVRRLGERVRAANQHIAVSGWCKVGPAAWGYRWRPATDEERRQGAPKSVLDTDAETAPYLREAFRRAADGESIRAVARWVAGLPAAARGGKQMKFSVVRGLLTAPVYVARVRLPDGTLTATPGHWPALVDAEVWHRVQERISQHSRIPRQASGRYLATGLLRCPACGERMQAGPSGDGSSVYRCSGVISKGASAADKACTYSVRRLPVDTALLAEVGGIVSALDAAGPGLRAALQREWRRLQQGSGDADVVKRIRSLELARDRAKGRHADAAILYVDKAIDKAGYELARDRARLDMDAADAEIQRLRGVPVAPTLPPLAEVLARLGTWSEVLRASDVPAQRLLLAELVERIEPHRVSHGVYDVRIAWTPLGEILSQVATAEHTAQNKAWC